MRMRQRRSCWRVNGSKGQPKTQSGTEPTLHDLPSWEVERRPDGAVIVRVHSRAVNGRALPDTVFAFRAGDPQFSFWEAQLRHRDHTAYHPPVSFT
jgi:hypothetical protein